MKTLLVLYVSVTSNLLLAQESPKHLRCETQDLLSLDLAESSVGFTLHAHKAGGLEVARALKLQNVGSYWRYTTAAVEFKGCILSAGGLKGFACRDELVPFKMGWPNYEDTFAKVSVTGRPSEDGFLVSLKIKDELRGLDVTDKFHFVKDDCHLEGAEKATSPAEQEAMYSCTPKCVDGVPYCCLRDDQCFKQQGKC